MCFRLLVSSGIIKGPKTYYFGPFGGKIDNEMQRPLILWRKEHAFSTSTNETNLGKQNVRIMCPVSFKWIKPAGIDFRHVDYP